MDPNLLPASYAENKIIQAQIGSSTMYIQAGI